VRPVKLLEPLRGMSPLKPERLGDLDLEIVRELAGGMYFGERGNSTEAARNDRGIPNRIRRRRFSGSQRSHMPRGKSFAPLIASPCAATAANCQHIGLSTEHSRCERFSARAYANAAIR